MSDRCKESVPNDHSVTFRRCSFKAWKDGYCKIHHPESVAARSKKSEERYQAQRAKSPYVLLQKSNELVEQLERENEALRKDAERYRWLREFGARARIYVPANRGTEMEIATAEKLDSAIDAAIKEQP